MAARGLQSAAESLSVQIALLNSWWLCELNEEPGIMRALSDHGGFMQVGRSLSMETWTFLRHRQMLLVRNASVPLQAAGGSCQFLGSASKCPIGHIIRQTECCEMGIITIWNEGDSCWERVLFQGARHTELQEQIAEGEGT